MYRDITNNRFGRLIALNKSSKDPKGQAAYWDCLCDCGNLKTVRVSSLVGGITKSCGCITTKHSMSKNRVYKIWCGIKSRCFNPNRDSFGAYGEVGILMQQDYAEDFLEFYKEVGNPPDKYSSIDRIDNQKGYIKGNMRWSSHYEQSRNKSMPRNNSSGFTGVVWEINKKNGLTRVCTFWREAVNGKIKARKKSFSVNKYGLMEAFAMACLERDRAIARLNEQGYGYSDKHGKHRKTERNQDE